MIRMTMIVSSMKTPWRSEWTPRLLRRHRRLGRSVARPFCPCPMYKKIEGPRRPGRALSYRNLTSFRVLTMRFIRPLVEHRCMATSLEDLGTITGLVAITRRDNANLIRDLRRAVCLHERGRTQGPGGLGRKRSYVHALAVGSSSWRAVRLTYSEEVRLTVSGAVSTILQWGSFKTRTRLRTSPLFSVYLVELLHLALAEEYVTGIIGDLMSFATGSAGTEDLGLHHAESSRHLGLLIPPLAVPSRMPVEEVRALARSTAIKVDEAVC